MKKCISILVLLTALFGTMLFNSACSVVPLVAAATTTNDMS